MPLIRARLAVLRHLASVLQKQPTLRRPYYLRRGVRRRLRVPRISRGEAERREALVRNAAPGGPPRGRADPWIARDHRPITLAGAPLGAPPRHFWRSLLRRSSGSRFREPAFAPTRPAGSLQSGPSAARAEPRSRPSAGLRGLPAGAALAPSAERLRKTPLSERGGGKYTQVNSPQSRIVIITKS